MSKKLRVYISGPMTGYPDFNREAFHKAEVKLDAAGFDAVNPAKFPEQKGWVWHHYMRYDIKLLVTDCTSIYMLDGWQHSRGAKLEREIAYQLGFTEVVYDYDYAVIKKLEPFCFGEGHLNDEVGEGKAYSLADGARTLRESRPPW
jgi:hypothetical protein